jgi:hypothetical protein
MIVISMFVVLTYNKNVDDCVWFQCSWWYRTIEDSRAGCLFFLQGEFWQLFSGQRTEPYLIYPTTVPACHCSFVNP